MTKYIIELFSDCKGRISSKRVVGIVAALSLLISSYIHPSTEIFTMVLTLALGGLGLTSAEKIFSKDNEIKKETNNEGNT